MADSNEASSQDHLDSVLAEMLVRVQGGSRVPPAPVLPDRKEDFPKLLLVDLCKWIELARSESSDAHRALDALRAARAAGRIVVAFTVDNVGEVALGGNDERKRDLARFIVAESDNVGFVNNGVLRDAELSAAIREHVLGAGPVTIRRGQLIHRGTLATCTVSGALPRFGVPTFDELMPFVIEQPEMSVELICRGLNHEQRTETYASERELITRLEKLRPEWARLPVDERRDNEIRNVFAQQPSPDSRAIALGGTTLRQFREWLSRDGNPNRLRLAVPHLRVMMDLLLCRDQNPQHPYKSNDGRDLSFVQVAIPHASIVLLEKAWTNIATRSGLTDAFQTQVVSHLRDLPEALRREGCM